MPDPDINAVVGSAAAAWSAAYYAMIEQACEAALTGGVCGVLVTRFDDGVTAAPSTMVPYGQIDYRSCPGPMPTPTERPPDARTVR